MDGMPMECDSNASIPDGDLKVVGDWENLIGEFKNRLRSHSLSKGMVPSICVERQQMSLLEPASGNGGRPSEFIYDKVEKVSRHIVG